MSGGPHEWAGPGQGPGARRLVLLDSEAVYSAGGTLPSPQQGIDCTSPSWLPLRGRDTPWVTFVFCYTRLAVQFLPQKWLGCLQVHGCRVRFTWEDAQRDR